MDTESASPVGILCIDKPAGPTSHDLVQWVRRTLRTRAVGHCGTLDPPATGLLIVCVGPATKLVPFLTASDKCYRARFRLGESSDTGDAAGSILRRSEVPASVRKKVLSAIMGMQGELMLRPPSVSALKVGGKRAHELVREGEVPELEPRPMTVHSVSEVLEGIDSQTALPFVEATIHVSKGSYIRSLAEELGRRLDVPCLMESLCRLSAGSFSLDHPKVVRGLEAYPPDEAAEVAKNLSPSKKRKPPRWRLTWAADGRQGDLKNNAATGPTVRSEADDADDQKRRGDRLRAALIPAVGEHLPFPVFAVEQSLAAKQAFSRFANGMVGRGSELFGATGDEEESLPDRIGVFEPDEGTLVIGETKSQKCPPEIAPKRVIRALR